MIFKKRLQWRLVEAWQCSLQGDAGVYPSAAWRRCLGTYARPDR
jgi:hypothetical protein